MNAGHSSPDSLKVAAPRDGFATFRGDRSSAVERLPVEEDVTGSNPVGHPILLR